LAGTAGQKPTTRKRLEKAEKDTDAANCWEKGHPINEEQDQCAMHNSALHMRGGSHATNTYSH
jgi:hypothetical protein